MKQASSTPGTRQRILQAANEVVLREGVGALTLDAVAHAAGVSKGGLLYHFPAKEALIAGMIDALVAGFEAALAARLPEAGGAEQTGSWLRAYIEETFAHDQPGMTLSAGLLAAVTTNPALLEPIRARYAVWQRQAETDGIDPVVGTLIRLAADGLFFAELLHLAPPGEPLRAQVARALLKLAGKREDDATSRSM